MIFKYIILNIVRLPLLVISLIFYPITFWFRNMSNKYVIKHGNMGWHPLQWNNWFFTRDGNIGDWYTGPYWYMKELKDKTFTKWINDEKDDPITETFKQKLVYFYISYNWSGWRNYMWNLCRILFKEGGIWEGADINNVEVKKNTVKIPLPVYLRTLPQLKYVDTDGHYMDNKGPYICYPGNEYDIPNNKCFVEGEHYGHFITAKNNKAFNYRITKIKPINSLNKLFCMEVFFGWDYWMGWLTLHMKFKFKKFNDRAKQDYQNYKIYLKTLNETSENI